MTARATFGWGLLGGLALVLTGCATAPPVVPPSVVATLPPPPPTMPAGGYIGMKNAPKLPDGTYLTPNLDNTDQAAVWHLRNALNVAALGCEQAGGGVLAPYNAWLQTHAAVIDRYYRAYIREWQEAGWYDWERVYDDNQTRIYNFYAQPAMRAAFCAVARQEIAAVSQVADGDLVTFARASLSRLDRPFTDFYAAYDAYQNYYGPTPPPVVRTIDAPGDVPDVTAPAVVATLSANEAVAAETPAPPQTAPGEPDAAPPLPN